MTHPHEHVINPSGRRLTDAQRAHRTAVVERNLPAADHGQAAVEARQPASSSATEHRVPTRLTIGSYGQLVHDDGTVVEHEAGAPRTLPRTGPVYGIDAALAGNQDTVGRSIFET